MVKQSLVTGLTVQHGLARRFCAFRRTHLLDVTVVPIEPFEAPSERLLLSSGADVMPGKMGG